MPAPAVVRDVCRQHPLGVGRLRQQEGVLSLAGPHSVVEQLLIHIGVRLGAQLAVPLLGRCIPVVEEALQGGTPQLGSAAWRGGAEECWTGLGRAADLVVVRPGGGGELDVLQGVLQVLGCPRGRVDPLQLGGPPVGAAAASDACNVVRHLAK